MRFRPLAIIPALTLVVVACSSGGSTALPSGRTSSQPAVDSASPGVQTIEVRLTDAYVIEPAAMTVKMGQPVRFRVMNAGTTDHEFYLGDDAAQAAHESEMASMGPMGGDEASGIVVKPGETKELTYTFAAAGAFLAGCHEQGHYLAGMKASITVTE